MEGMCDAHMTIIELLESASQITSGASAPIDEFHVGGVERHTQLLCERNHGGDAVHSGD